MPRLEWPGGGQRRSSGPNGLGWPTDQRSKIGTFNIAPSFVHLIGTEAVFTIGAFVRQDQFNYYSERESFRRLLPTCRARALHSLGGLTNAGLRSDISYVKGMHNIKAGITYEQTFLTEKDSLGIVDPTFLPSLDRRQWKSVPNERRQPCTRRAQLWRRMTSRPAGTTTFSAATRT